MQKSVYFSGQKTKTDDLNNTESTREDEIQERSNVHASTFGVAFGLVLSNPGATTTIRISPGQAVDDNNHERIEVISNEDLVIAGVGDEGRLVVIEYTPVLGTSVSHPTTGAANDTRETASFTASIVDDGSETADQVILGKILDTNSGAGPITFDLTSREFLTSRVADGALTDDQHDQTDGLITHRDAVGTGTPSGTNPHGNDISDFDGFTADASNETHQDAQHANGLLGAATALQPSIVAGPPDSLSFTDLAGSDRLWVQGKEFSVLASTTLAFVDNNTVELWSILIDNTATPAKSLRLDKTAASVPNVTGVKIVNVSRHTPAVASVILSFVFTGSTLSWNGGALVTVASDGGQYRLYSGTANSLDETHYVDVQVTSPLPGSSQTDTYEVHVLHVEDDFYEIGRAVFNTAAAIEFLIDDRNFGVVEATQVQNKTFDDERQQPQHVGLKGVASDGVVTGLEVTSGGASFDVAGGFAFLDGRLIFFPSGSVGAIAGSTNFVILDADPNYSSGSRHTVGAATLRVVPATDPRTLLTPNSARFILLGFATVTGGPTIGTITDTRPFPYRIATDLQPNEAGDFEGDPKFGGTVLIKDGGALDFGTSTAQLTNMPDDAVSTDALQDGAVSELKVDQTYRRSLRQPVRSRIVPPSFIDSGGYIYEIAPGTLPDTQKLRVHTFQIGFYDETNDDFDWTVLTGTASPIQDNGDAFFDLDWGNVTHGPDGSGHPWGSFTVVLGTWYFVYAKNLQNGFWQPFFCPATTPNNPNLFLNHPDATDGHLYRWLGCVKTTAATTNIMGIYKTFNGQVLWSTPVDSVSTSDIEIFDQVEFNSGWDTVSLAGVIPPGVREIYVKIETRSSVATWGWGHAPGNFFPDSSSPTNNEGLSYNNGYGGRS